MSNIYKTPWIPVKNLRAAHVRHGMNASVAPERTR